MLNKQDQWFLEYINNLRKSKFYGNVTLQFKEGKLVMIREEKTVKPPQAVEDYISV